MPLRFRLEERNDRDTLVGADGFPIPPVRLRYRVHGGLSTYSFLAVGARCANNILSLLDRLGLQPPDDAAVLDFGCGTGRVLRALLRERPQWTYTAVDIDGEAIDWSRQAYPREVRFEKTPGLPPTDLASNAFDLVFVVSIFTHLDERYQNAWLAELLQITRPGGVVVATVAGQRDRELLPKGEQERLERDGILFTSWRRGRLKLDGLPDFYQSTYHERSYVEREWPRSGFELVAYVPASINAGQDAVVLRKPPPGATSTLPS